MPVTPRPLLSSGFCRLSVRYTIIVFYRVIRFIASLRFIYNVGAHFPLWNVFYAVFRYMFYVPFLYGKKYFSLYLGMKSVPAFAAITFWATFPPPQPASPTAGRDGERGNPFIIFLFILFDFLGTSTYDKKKTILGSVRGSVCKKILGIYQDDGFHWKVYHNGVQNTLSYFPSLFIYFMSQKGSC